MGRTLNISHDAGAIMKKQGNGGGGGENVIIARNWESSTLLARTPSEKTIVQNLQ